MNAVSYAVNSDALQPIFQLTSRGINVDQLYKKVSIRKKVMLILRYLFLPFFLDLKLLFTCFCNVNCKQLRRCKRSISSLKRSAKTVFDNFLLFESISIFRTFFQQFQTLLSDMLSLSSLFIVLSNCITEYKRVHGISLRSLPIFKSRRFSSSLLTSFKAKRLVIRCLVSN